MTAANVRTLSLREAADHLGLPGGKSGTAGYQRLYKMAQAGTLPTVKVGRERRVSVTVLEQMVQAQP